MRPLFDDDADDPSAVTRDYVLDLDAPAGAAPMLSVFGGKITTYRKLAEHGARQVEAVLSRLGRFVDRDGAAARRRHSRRRLRRLCRRGSRAPAVARPNRSRLALGRRHGTRVERVLGDARSLADLGRDFGGGLTEREARYLRAEEWARKRRRHPLPPHQMRAAHERSRKGRLRRVVGDDAIEAKSGSPPARDERVRLMPISGVQYAFHLLTAVSD